ncbi:CBS domain-containing protein [Bremerella cremea]|uniref:CBS domain-containing protein n=1 Tax=Bremerella cremea TaxID=1031537 RepID=A0A368KNG8_9BACT|nr:CBS domain-containing protein [Bremerella cremea]RCS44691.1 CBS domain-containing protein [Bremerella cremea]
MIVRESFLSHGIESLVTFNPICIHRDTQLDELLERLYSTGFHHWPVIDNEKRLIGIVSDQDIVRAAAEREAASTNFQVPRDSLQISIADIMQTHLVTIDAQETGQTALARFLESGYHSLPVTQGENLVGMITTSDFIREFAYSQHPAKDVAVSQIYDRLPHLIDSETTLDNMRIELLSHHAKYCLVTQGEYTLGVLSERDLRRQKCREIAQTLYHEKPAQVTRAIELIRPNHHVPSNTTLGDVAQWMNEAQANVVMVCSRDLLQNGVISQEHLLQYVANYEQNAST